MLGHIVKHAALYIALEIHKRESTGRAILLRLIARLYRNNNTRIGPLGITGRIGHTIEYHSFIFGRRRDQNTTRAHAERVHSPLCRLAVRTGTDNLLYKAVLCGRHARLPIATVTNLVDKGLRMLYANTQRKTLGLKLTALG